MPGAYPPPPDFGGGAPAQRKAVRARRHSGYGDRVEEIDRKILLLLAHDGRMSFTDLARQTGLSVSATHQRVRRLERRHYRQRLDLMMYERNRMEVLKELGADPYVD